MGWLKGDDSNMLGMSFTAPVCHEFTVAIAYLNSAAPVTCILYTYLGNR